MDETPQILRDVHFREKFRGYDPDEVDAFLERLGKALAALQRQVEEAQSRADAAEAAAAKATSGGADRSASPTPAVDGRSDTAALHDPDGAIARTLATAQRAADAAVREAQHEAAARIAEAEGEAKKILGAAQGQRRRVREEAANEARRVADATRRPIVAEIKELERRRDILLDDCDVLERHLNQNRDQLAEAIGTLSLLVENPESFRVSGRPELHREESAEESEREVAAVEEQPAVRQKRRAAKKKRTVQPAPRPPENRTEPPEADVEAEPASVPAGRSEAEGADEPKSALAVVDDDSAVDEPSDAGAVVDLTDRAEAQAEAERKAAAPAEVVELAAAAASGGPARDPGWHRTGEPAWADDGGPPTEAVQRIDELLAPADESGDAFLSEVRRAADADDLGPPAEDEESAMAAFFDQDEDEPKGRRLRFGRR